MSTPKPPDGVELPTFFIDRDLGRIAFPDGLRAAGLSIVTIAEHYGVQASEQIEDETWMFEAAEHDWPVFCCDSQHRKRRRPAERAALLSSGLRELMTPPAAKVGLVLPAGSGSRVGTGLGGATEWHICDGSRPRADRWFSTLEHRNDTHR